MIMKLSPRGNPIPLLLVSQVSSRNSKGSPLAGVSNNGGVSKISSFRPSGVSSSKTVSDTAKVTIN